MSVYLCLGYSNKHSIYDQIQKIKSMIVSMLQNLSKMYYSHNSNIKSVDLTIQCIDFESFHCAINLSYFIIYGF